MSLLPEKGIFNFEDLKDLRRLSFVTAIETKMSTDNLASYFGDVDIALLYGFGIKPLPLEGLDSYIFEYGFHEGCDQVRSTLVYLKTEKCPILYSSKFYVLDDYCHVLKEELKKATEKDVVNHFDLHSYLNDRYEFSEELFEEAKADLMEIDSLYEKIKETSIGGYELFLLKFYSRYIIDLNKRIQLYKNVLNLYSTEFKDANNTHSQKRYEVYAICPGGIIDGINADLCSKCYEIKEKEGMYAVRGCYKRSKHYVNYGG